MGTIHISKSNLVFGTDVILRNKNSLNHDFAFSSVVRFMAFYEVRDRFSLRHDHEQLGCGENTTYLQE